MGTISFICLPTCRLGCIPFVVYAYRICLPSDDVRVDVIKSECVFNDLLRRKCMAQYTLCI